MQLADAGPTEQQSRLLPAGNGGTGVGEFDQANTYCIGGGSNTATAASAAAAVSPPPPPVAAPVELCWGFRLSDSQ